MLAIQSDKMYLECDVFLTHAQVGRDVPVGSSTGDFLQVERKSLPIELVVSVSPSERPHKFWYKKDGRWEKASHEVCNCSSALKSHHF